MSIPLSTHGSGAQLQDAQEAASIRNVCARAPFELHKRICAARQAAGVVVHQSLERIVVHCAPAAGNLHVAVEGQYIST